MSSPNSVATADTYHLKWNSHLNNLNLSLKNLFKDEKYTDVMLISSYPNEFGYGIPAHKIILSSYSTYFSSIFDMNPYQKYNMNTSSPSVKVTNNFNGVIYVVLPPELSYEAIKILVQYMYLGEATISNDILNEVLRGGELLKIRGLYRNNKNNIINGNNSDNHSLTTINDRNNSKITDGDKQQNNFSSVISPVIIRPSRSTLYQPSSQAQHHHEQLISESRQTIISSTPSKSISVRKEIAIDPDHVNLSSSSLSSKNMQKESSLYKKQQILLNRGYTPSPPLAALSAASTSSPLSSPLEIRTQPNQSKNEFDCENQNQQNDIRSPLYREQSNGSRCSSNSSSEYKLSIYKRGESLPSNITVRLSESPLTNILPTSNLQLKQEPIDWSSDQNSNSSKGGEDERAIKTNSSSIIPLLNIIKSESDKDDDNDSSDKDDNLAFTPLTCELCEETFRLPKDWVRHLEEHNSKTFTTESSKTPHHQMKKKRKLQHNLTESEITAKLKCDLCSTFFDTPADWVRHTQNFHTETELAISNVKHGSTSSLQTLNAASSLTPTTSNSKKKVKIFYNDYLNNLCPTCKKTFSSYADMLTHTKNVHSQQRQKKFIQQNK